MNNYQLVEFTSSKRIEHIRSDKVNLADVLFEIYGKKVTTMFNEQGQSLGYISVFINSNQISTINDVVLKPNDEICIVTSIAGG